MKHYMSELLVTENLETSKRTYYIKICGVFRRVTKADYDKRCAESYRQDTFLTQQKGKFLRRYKTVYMSFPG